MTEREGDEGRVVALQRHVGGARERAERVEARARVFHRVEDAHVAALDAVAEVIVRLVDLKQSTHA